MNNDSQVSPFAIFGQIAKGLAFRQPDKN